MNDEDRKNMRRVIKRMFHIPGLQDFNVCIFGNMKRESYRWTFGEYNKYSKSWEVFFRCPKCKRLNNIPSGRVEAFHVPVYKFQYVKCTQCVGCRDHFGTFLVGYEYELEKIKEKADLSS